METLLNLTKYTLPAVALVAAVALFAGGCSPRYGGRHGGWGGDPGAMERKLDRHVDHLLDEVDATGDQRSQILAIRDRLREEHRALHGSREGFREELRAAWDDEVFDAQAAHRRVDDRIEEMTRFVHLLVDAAADLHGVLTPDQRATLARKLEGCRPR